MAMANMAILVKILFSSNKSPEKMHTCQVNPQDKVA